MDDFYSPEDHYCYQNSPVLKNRLGLNNLPELDRAEKLFVNARLIDVSAVPRTFDYTHFRALHFHMFQDIMIGQGGNVMSSSLRATPLLPARCISELRVFRPFHGCAPSCWPIDTTLGCCPQPSLIS